MVGVRRFFTWADKPRGSHQAHDALASTLDAARFQQGMNARAAIDLVMLQEDLLDVGAQTGIFSAMLARLSAAPSIIAALGDLQRLAEHRDRVVTAVLGNERKAQSWLREKMPSASDRISPNLLIFE